MTYDDIKITINGVDLPAPAVYDVTFSDLDAESIRPITTGILERNRIRSNVMRIDLEYFLKDLPTITSILQQIASATFSVTVHDLSKGTVETKTMYAGDRKFTYIRVQEGIKGKGFKFPLIEC